MLFETIRAGRKDVGAVHDLSDAVGVHSLRHCTAPTPHMGGSLYDKDSVILKV